MTGSREEEEGKGDRGNRGKRRLGLVHTCNSSTGDSETQEGFEDSPGYIVKLCLKTHRNKTKQKVIVA